MRKEAPERRLQRGGRRQNSEEGEGEEEEEEGGREGRKGGRNCPILENYVRKEAPERRQEAK